MPTTRQLIAVKTLAKMLRSSKNQKNISMQKILKIAGYSDSQAVASTQVTQSKGFRELIEELMPDSDIAAQHRKLLHARETDHYLMPASLSDKEIQDMVEELEGFKVRKIIRKKGETTAYVLFYRPDGLLIDKALDKIYKIKGHYAPEKQEHKITGIKVVNYADSHK